jgi:hypothetical protein
MESVLDPFTGDIIQEYRPSSEYGSFTASYNFS